MLNNKGSVLLEILVAVTILLFITLLLSPLFPLLAKERTVLKDRRMISSALHDELQKHLWSKTIYPIAYEENIHGKTIQFIFIKDNKMVEGCVFWKNVRNQDEEFCLFGFPKE